MFEIREKPQMVERALLIGVYFDKSDENEARSLLEELAELVNTLEIGIVDSLLVKVRDQHAGTLMGITNTAGTIPGIIGVYVSGLILQWTDSWTLVFQVAAAINLFGLLFYLVFARTEVEFD